MVISHLKYSYINWRAIPCRRKMICAYVVFFIIFSTFFFAFWFLFKFNQNFQVHDITWQSIFFFTICLLRATMHAIDGLPSWRISSHVRIVLKGLTFDRRVIYVISIQRRIMAQKLFSRKWTILINMPQGINQGDFRISRS